MKQSLPLGVALGAPLALVCGCAALAAPLEVPLPDGVQAQQTQARYQCAQLGALKVDYVTAGPIALAILPLDGQMRVFAQVLSGSGARYASGLYVWWAKGTDATLQDLRKGEAAPPVACKGLP